MALHDLGSLLLGAGRPREATEYLRQGAALEPLNGMIQADLRTALFRQGSLEEARVAWRQALDAYPQEHDAWFGYAELCLFLGHEDEYRRHRRELLGRFAVSKTPVVCERTARACLLSPGTPDEMNEAATLADRAVAAGRLGHESGYPYFVFARGLADFRLGRFDDALNRMRGEAARVPGPSPRLVAAMALHQVGKSDEAKNALLEAIRTFDWNLAKAGNHDAWIAHILRREAEALINPAPPAASKHST
jgi:serine/threonine-protein kinase